ncbi:uncharacterized protein LOC117644749 [Thrips palmi]|uniref:Uncharacterized protein LOC117644749 n=1 Tax=Thrips palmi TaxID=161013 RepID=A0A6P8ZMA3_THRPL|nr:uncharacterized protein LOC117644749 [Thrips palmi]
MPADCLAGTAGWLARFWRWSRGGYSQGRSYPTSVMNHRGWLWPLGRLTGLLPISFKECVCSAPFNASRAGSEHAVNDSTLPSWDQPAHVATSRCSCPVAERSIPWLAYSFAVVLVLVPSAMWGLYSDSKNANTEGKPSLRMQSKTDMMVTFCDIISVSFCSVTCFAQLAFSQTALFMVLEQLQQVDRTLSVRAPAVPGMLALWLLVLVGVIFMDGVMWTEISNTISYAATYFPFYVVYFLTFMMEVLFIDDAHGIYMRFLALNEKLDQSLALPTYQAATEQLPFGAVDGGWLGEAAPRGTAVSITGIAESNGMYSSKTGEGRDRSQC